MVQEETSQAGREGSDEKVLNSDTFSSPENSDPADILALSLNRSYSLAEWEQIFAKLTDLLAHPEERIWHRAVRRLTRALQIATRSQRSHHNDSELQSTRERLNQIFAVITTQSLQKPEIFEVFCARFEFLASKEPYQHWVLEWLDQLANLGDRPAPTQTAIFAAQLLLGAYDSTWQAVGTTLLELLDHADLTVRACAAYQIGLFCQKAVLSKDDVWEWDDDEKYERDKQSVVGMPPVAVLMQLIRTKELERPGVAGAFWNAIPKEGFDAEAWLLDILENLPEPEPDITYFPCNLAFDAHERFSRDANAVRRLIDMGRIDIALAAATDEACKIAALAPLLIELGHTDDPKVVRVASWQLAYYYHYLHPRGAELGYVEWVDELSEIDLFLLFSQPHMEPPYAVVIYPPGKEQKFSRAVAQQWVDQIFPTEVRGKLRDELSPIFYPCDHPWYQRGYVEYYQADPTMNSEQIDQIIIGYRSDFPWNPKQFL